MTRKPAILCAVALLAAATAAADTVQAQLVESSLTGAPGDTLAYYVTLSNPSLTDTIYLNAIGSTASSAFLDVDTSPFDINAPFFLNPGDSSGPFELFDVTIDPLAPAGGYVGSVVSIVGGADGGQFTAFDDLADISFDVQVTGGVTSAPEPSALLLMLTGMAIVFTVSRKRVSR